MIALELKRMGQGVYVVWHSLGYTDGSFSCLGLLSFLLKLDI
jgi:hypothetical protein